MKRERQKEGMLSVSLSFHFLPLVILVFENVSAWVELSVTRLLRTGFWVNFGFLFFISFNLPSSPQELQDPNYIPLAINNCYLKAFINRLSSTKLHLGLLFFNTVCHHKGLMRNNLFCISSDICENGECAHNLARVLEAKEPLLSGLIDVVRKRQFS